jgi:hypothetical protein
MIPLDGVTVAVSVKLDPASSDPPVGEMVSAVVVGMVVMLSVSVLEVLDENSVEPW